MSKTNERSGAKQGNVKISLLEKVKKFESSKAMDRDADGTNFLFFFCPGLD